MSLKYTCPRCGTPLGYEGLCWKCKCERERNAALAWTPEQIAEKQKKNYVQLTIDFDIDELIKAGSIEDDTYTGSIYMYYKEEG